jgi:hypothetical protein
MSWEPVWDRWRVSYAKGRPRRLFGRGTSISESLSSVIPLNTSGSWEEVKLVFTSEARAGAGASVGVGVGLRARAGVAVLAVVVRTWNRVGLLIYACLAASACFALTGNTPLCYAVLLLGTLASLMADRSAVSAADHVLAVLSRMPIRVALKALGDLAVPVKHFTVVKLATKQQTLIN